MNIWGFERAGALAIAVAAIALFDVTPASAEKGKETEAAAAKKAEAVVAGLTVKPHNMERNLWLQKGLLMSEPVMMALGAKFGRQQAHEMVYEICMKVFEADSSFKDGLLDHPEIKRNLSPEKIDEMLDPHVYTGSAEFFVDRIVGLARKQE